MEQPGDEPKKPQATALTPRGRQSDGLACVRRALAVALNTVTSPPISLPRPSSFFASPSHTPRPAKRSLSSPFARPRRVVCSSTFVWPAAAAHRPPPCTAPEKLPVETSCSVHRDCPRANPIAEFPAPALRLGRRKETATQHTPAPAARCRVRVDAVHVRIAHHRPIRLPPF